MANVLAQTDPATPLIIWMMLMVAAVPAMMLLADPQSMRRPALAVLAFADVLRHHAESRTRARREAATATRYADDVLVAAQCADDAVRQRQESWSEAGQHTGEEWLAWQTAEQQVTRARAAAAFGAPDTARTPAEYVDRERFLHRTVRLAVRDGDLPVTALSAVLTGRDGWDPRLHPVEQELAVLRAVAAHRLLRYRRAVVAERAAEQNIKVAMAAREELRVHAVIAERRRSRPSPLLGRMPVQLGAVS